MKHKIRMLKTQPGVDDGELHPRPYLEGEEYEVGSELLQSFIDLGVVELADAAREKSRGDAPANTMRKTPPENK